MYRKMFVTFVIFLSLVVVSEAQMRRAYGRPRYGRQERVRPSLPKFEPTVNLSIGYGFPSLDKDYLPVFYSVYRGDISQTGPVTASLDYQFSRMMSIGVMVTRGKVNAPYYDYSGAGTPQFTAELSNWSFMLDLVRYIPVSGSVTPYIRTAVGVNAWEQRYTDPSGNKASVVPVELPDFSYQAGLGVRFNLAKKAGVFAEVGYGKYILHGGLALRF